MLVLYDVSTKVCVLRSVRYYLGTVLGAYYLIQCKVLTWYYVPPYKVV